MRKVLFASMLCLTLGGCPSGTVITPQSVIAEVQSVCGIVTTVADIAALIASQPALVSVASFASEICGAFKAQPATPTASGAGGVIVVNNVPIHYTLK